MKTTNGNGNEGNRTGKMYGERTTPEMERVGREIVDAAFKVHTTLGPGLLESVYETCLEYELKKRGLRVERQKKSHDLVRRNRTGRRPAAGLVGGGPGDRGM